MTIAKDSRDIGQIPTIERWLASELRKIYEFWDDWRGRYLHTSSHAQKEWRWRHQWSLLLSANCDADEFL